MLGGYQSVITTERIKMAEVENKATAKEEAVAEVVETTEKYAKAGKKSKNTLKQLKLKRKEKPKQLRINRQNLKLSQKAKNQLLARF